MTEDTTKKIESMEKAVNICNGRPVGEELPQVPNSEQIAETLITEKTGKHHNR